MHNLDFSKGYAGIAITWNGETPWHGYGNRVPDGADLDQWRVAAGLDWEIERRKVLYGIMKDDGKKGLAIYPDRDVLLRSDTEAPLSIVSKQYHVVQPAEVMEFYRDLIDAYGFKMETAGSLAGGRRIWALAKTGDETRIMGQDQIRAHLLLATSYDGTMATTGKYVDTRVVCENTIQVALGEGGATEFRLTHSKKFDPEEAKGALGLSHEVWQEHVETVNKLASKTVDLETAMAFFTKVLGDDAVTVDKDSGKIEYSTTFEKMFTAYNKGPGSQFRSAHNTAWGLVNAVTFFQDHMAKTNKQGSRLNSSWFGAGANRKQKAWEEAVALAA